MMRGEAARAVALYAGPPGILSCSKSSSKCNCFADQYQ